MQLSPVIRFLTNKEIDKACWDECIKQSPNRLLYARTFYLDNMAPGWDALIGENYDWVFPITARRKYGISYLSQPPLSQQLGVFAKPNVIAPFANIVEWLKQYYRFWEINVNYSTDTRLILPPVKISAATNFLLDLSADYKSMTAKYQKDLKKNIKRSERLQLRYQETNDYHKPIELFIKYYSGRLGNIKAKDYTNFSNICGNRSQKNKLLVRKAVNSSNEILSIALLFIDGKRLYNLMNATTEAGRKAEANHFLFDSIIREFAGTHFILDFEGSDVPGINKFYKNFGGENQPFYLLKYNNLPWPLNLFKE